MDTDIKCKFSPLETICMKSRRLFSGQNMKNIINLSAVDSYHREVKVKLKIERTLLKFKSHLD